MLRIIGGLAALAVGLAQLGAAVTREPLQPSTPPELSRPEKAPPTKYFEVPIVGVIGTDVLPQGVREVLAAAKRQHVRAVVLRFATTGGEVGPAQDIGKVMREFAGDCEYYGIVEQCLSAGMWPLVECDRILVSPASTIGAAVAYAKNSQTGTKTALDAKQESALAAMLGAANEAKGRDRILVRAMVVQEAEVYSWKGPSDPIAKVFDSKPDAKLYPGAKQIDDAKSVLTLTGTQAIELGFAEDLGASGVGKGPGWVLVSKLGAAAMQRAKDAATKARKADVDAAETRVRDFQKVDGWSKEIDKLVAVAKEKDPAQYDDYTMVLKTSGDGRSTSVTWSGVRIVNSWAQVSTRETFSMASAQKSTQRSDAAADAWKSIRAGIDDIYTIMRKYKEDDFSPSVIAHLQSVDREAADTIQELLGRRNPYAVYVPPKK